MKPSTCRKAKFTQRVLSAIALLGLTATGVFGGTVYTNTIYSTGFEPGPDGTPAASYSIGPLTGQNGWLGTVTSIVDVVGQPSIPGSTQGVSLISIPGFTFAAKDILFGASQADVQVQLNVLNASTTPWAFQVDNGGLVAGEVVINPNGSITVLGTGGGTTAPGTIITGLLPGAPGAGWNFFDQVIDYNTGKYDTYLNGALLFAGVNILNPIGSSPVDLNFAIHDGGVGAGGEILLDNYSVAVPNPGAPTPEPSTLIMMASGFLMMGLGVLRHRRKVAA